MTKAMAVEMMIRTLSSTFNEAKLPMGRSRSTLSRSDEPVRRVFLSVIPAPLHAWTRASRSGTRVHSFQLLSHSIYRD